jgi:hypothetical protein
METADKRRQWRQREATTMMERQGLVLKAAGGHETTETQCQPQTRRRTTVSDDSRRQMAAGG